MQSPLVLVAPMTGGLRITAADRKAHALGIGRGELLADARARVPALRTQPAESAQDAQALGRLARSMTRFTPWATPWPDMWNGQGLTLDITGSSHLFGGEAGQEKRMRDALFRLRITAKIAIADTPGAAYALARYGQTNSLIVPVGQTETAVRPLPVESLRIPDETAFTLKRLGLQRIGDLLFLPRKSLTARFGALLGERLDQILGLAPEPVSPLSPAPVYRTSATLAEPITHETHIVMLIRRLAQELSSVLERDGQGARLLRFKLFRVDGDVADLEVAFAQASRSPDHMAKLFSLRLDALCQEFDAGFGYEAACLEALTVEPLTGRQTILADDCASGRSQSFTLLIDRLGTRLGIENVLRLYPRESHIPERAIVARPAMRHGREREQETWDGAGESPLRPILMLPAPEHADVVALLPEGPPRQFRWRGVRYAVVRAEGPERIRPEWWRREKGRTRDYYIVEDEEGRRFWLYREGLYAQAGKPCWFVHGVFP